MYGNTNAEPIFHGATTQAAGVAGIVPAPAIQDHYKFLRNDGVWSDVVNHVTQSTTITGDGVTTQFNVTHNLETLDVFVQVYDLTTYETVLPDIKRTDTGHVQIIFNEAPVADKTYKVLISKTMTAGVYFTPGEYLTRNNYTVSVPLDIAQNETIATREYVTAQTELVDETTQIHYQLVVNNGYLGLRTIE